ncbi:MAG: type II toxin-antitoxin system RelE/ParE family toxin [Candidatus Heimdallarchaeota archaeon]
MTKYLIEIKKSVKKDFKRIPIWERTKIINLIEALSDNPRPFGYRKLKAKESMYRIQYKDYRVLSVV